jgi:hypothetical protein
VTDFGSIEQRLETLQAAVASGRVDDSLLEEVDAALTDGYLTALRADARCRRLPSRLHRLADEPTHAADEAWRLASETRAIADSTRELRARLGELRSPAARYAAARCESA